MATALNMNIFKRSMIFVTFFGGCFSISLLAAALGTRFWYESDAKQYVWTSREDVQFRPNSTGHVNFGLFRGRKSLNVGFGERIHSIDETPELMDKGLWVSTIFFLSCGLLFAVVGALFAVVNTATTPVEAITGVPGLYAWNIIAALMDLIAIICWSVQHSVHLSENVLIENEKDGWTTKGEERLGYSFWLVFAAIIVHIGNCVIIRVGMYEPRKKEQVEVPDGKGGNIMLY